MSAVRGSARESIVIVAADGIPFEAPDAYLLRLVAPPKTDDRFPTGAFAAARRAADRLHTVFPDWLWQWTQDSGLLSLATYEGPISWWWYTPISEMGPLRSPLIRQLYWLLLLREIIRESAIGHVTWVGDDLDIANAARDVAVAEGASFESRVRRRWHRDALRIPRQVSRRMWMFGRAVAIGLLARLAGFGAVEARDPDVLLFSRFPVLWETRSDGWTERMFAEWPEVLTAKGHRLVNAVVFTGPVRWLVTRRSQLLPVCRRQTIVMMEAFASLGTVLAAYADVLFVFKYLRWRRTSHAARFEGVDVTTLVRRELDAAVAGFEIASDRVLVAALGRFMDRTPSLRTAFFPFEFQPIERAITMAARRHEVATVGLQTALYTPNHLGFRFAPSQVRTVAADAARAPMPDVVAAYGELPQRVFADRLGSGRVVLSGPIRYARLNTACPTDFDARVALGMPIDTTVVLVTTSMVRAESTAMLEAAFHAASSRPGLFLALKFHYHLPLDSESAACSRRYPKVSYQIYESRLDELLTVSRAMICGGSSTGIEAIARGCMPLVFNLVGDFLPNPMLEAAESVFIWHTPRELDDALTAVLEGGEAVARRRAHWPDVMRAQLYPLSSDMNERLYSHLEERSILGRPA